jgi:hypothetical protein
MDCVTLIERAKEAGLSVLAEGPRLIVRGPRRSHRVAQELLNRKSEVLAALNSLSKAVCHTFADKTRSAAAKSEILSAGNVEVRARRQLSCQRCGSPAFVDTRIHGGRSVRRDCDRCGITWGFPVWFGVVNEAWR